MLVKTSALKDEALDWAIASIEKLPRDVLTIESGKPVVHRKYWDEITILRCEFGTNWTQGGPIVERERICIDVGHDGVWLACSKQNYEDRKEFINAGHTPLIAALRCYVQMRLGDEINVPDELCVNKEVERTRHTTGSMPVPESVDECEFGYEEYNYRLREAGL